MSLKTDLNAYIKHNNEAAAYLMSMQSSIQGVCDFEIYLNHFSADGLCVMDADTATGMSIGSVIDIIKKKGKLTKEDWIDIY